MSKRQVTDLDEIQQHLLEDPAMTEAVSRDENGVYVLGADGTKRYITELTLEVEDRKGFTHEIIKFQRPIGGNASQNEIMFYNEDRSADGIIPLNDKMIDDIFGSDVKAYWWCYVPEKEGTIDIVGRALDQPW